MNSLTSTPSEKRIYGIDALRAIAMMLGIVLHASIAYKAKPHRNWIHDDQFNSWPFDFLYSFIHSFRMPLFFLIAGFFCRMLYYKIGEASFIRHRWKRIGLPFVVAMIIIVPISLIPYNFYVYYYIHNQSYQEALRSCVQRLFRYSGLAHLWFLYYLLLFYAFILILLRIKRIQWVAELCSKGSQWLQKTNFNKFYWILILAIPMWICMLPEHDLYVSTDTYIIPRRMNNLFFYFYSFMLGWCLQKRSDIFGLLMKYFRPMVAAGLIIYLILFVVIWNTQVMDNGPLFALVKFAGAIQVFFLVFGFIGLFLHYFKTESHLWKYISDASYWVYLVHLGIVTGLQLLFLDSPVPGILKFPLVLGVTLIITFVSYQYFVRYSFIGNILHGHRKRPQSAQAGESLAKSK